MSTITLNNGCFMDESCGLTEPTVLELMFAKGSTIAEGILGTAGDGKFHYAKLGDGFAFVPVGHKGIVSSGGRSYMLFEPVRAMTIEEYQRLLSM